MPDFAGVARRYCFADWLAREVLEARSQNLKLNLSDTKAQGDDRLSAMVWVRL